MKKLFSCIATAVAILGSGSSLQATTQSPDSCADKACCETFWLGADISGTTADEARGHFTMTTDGEVRETTRLMKDFGLNATRFRVWVDPKDGFCSPQDVLKMALRSKELGMPVMIDFHYSDWWADPGKQNPPAAWKDMSYEEMKKAVANHTRSTLQLLKDNNIDVKWVQVGNETTHGMLWPMGRFEDNPEQYAGLTKAGVEAVREVYPNATVIIHLDDGFDQALYDRVFDSLKSYGVEWDMIGMSVYPFWALDGKKQPSEIMTLVNSIINIRHLKKKYGTDVMIVETGVDARKPQEGKKFIEALIKASRELTDGACKGVFYWAPEIDADEAYHLGAFANGKPTAIMDAFKEAARCNKCNK